MTATFTSDFQHEYRAALTHLLRRRFLWYAGVTIGMSGLFLLPTVAFVIYSIVQNGFNGAAAGSIINLALGLVSVGCYVAAFLHVRKRTLERDALLRLVFWLILVPGAIGLTAGVLAFEVSMRFGAGDIDLDRLRTGKRLIGLSSAFNILVYHLFACLFLPWTPRESLKPIWPLLGLNVLITVIYASGAVFLAVLTILLSPLVALPGVGICLWRQSRFKDRFTFTMLKSRYGEIRQELHSARQIHESLFPVPIREGPIRFDFRYEPMRAIGGDYFYADLVTLPGRAAPVLNLVLIDVTGHGITAALTVNRLYGEIRREFGETPDLAPGALLSGLNAYLHHTLATHSVYATALCVRIDPAQHTLEWASAGHPPAFVRSVDGTVDRLDSTTFVLGACRGDDFVHGECLARLGPGDRLIMYTDGAIEARNPLGKMLGVAGLEKIIAMATERHGGWLVDDIVEAVDQHRSGPPEDDTLLIEVSRGL